MQTHSSLVENDNKIKWTTLENARSQLLLSFPTFSKYEKHSLFYLTIQFHLHSVDLLVCLLKVVLFDIGTIYHKLGSMKSAFWNRTHIGIPDPDTESNDAVVLGYLVAQFIGEVKNVWRVQNYSTTIIIILCNQQVFELFNAVIVVLFILLSSPGPPLFLDQTEAQRAEKIFLGDLSQAPPPRPFTSRSGSGTDM